MSEIRMRYVGRHQEPFGDTKTIWEIESDLPKHKVMEFCQREILSNRPMTGYQEWIEKVRGDADMNYYLSGYCSLDKYKDGVWRFTKVTPYTD